MDAKLKELKNVLEDHESPEVAAALLETLKAIVAEVERIDRRVEKVRDEFDFVSSKQINKWKR